MTKSTHEHPGRGRTRPVLLAAACLLCSVLPALAVPVTDTSYGSQRGFLLPEINAMGATGAALYRGGISGILNPAYLVVEEGTRLDAGLSLDQETEDRFVPLYDTFDNVVAQTAIASNRHHYFGTGFALAHRVEGAAAPFAVAVSLTDRLSFAYDFEEDLLDPNPFADPRDRLIQYRAQTVDGTLRALAGSAAVELNPHWSLGGSILYNFGTRDQVRSLRNYVAPAESFREEVVHDLDGIGFVFGSRFVLSERLEVGIAYETSWEAAGNLTTETVYGADPDSVHLVGGTASIQYPQRVRAGFSYHPRSNPRTVFTAEAVFTEWSDLEDSRVAADEVLRLEDTMDYRVGVEHTFYNGVPLWFGFRQLDAYSDREAGLTLFSAGIGMPTAAGMVTTSIEIGKITSRQDHLFAYPSGFASRTFATVEESNMRFGVGFRRSF